MRSVCHCVRFQPKLDFSKNPSGGSLVFLLAHRDGRTDGHVSYLETKGHSGNHVRCLPHLYRQQNKRIKFVTAQRQCWCAATVFVHDVTWRWYPLQAVLATFHLHGHWVTGLCVQLRMNTHAHRTELIDRAVSRYCFSLFLSAIFTTVMKWTHNTSNSPSGQIISYDDKGPLGSALQNFRRNFFYFVLVVFQNIQNYNFACIYYKQL